MRRLTALEYLRACSMAALTAPAFLARPYRSARAYRAYQTRRIARLLRHAYDNTTFYRRLYDEAGVTPSAFRELGDLSRFPTTTKAVLIGALENGELDPPARSKG